MRTSFNIKQYTVVIIILTLFITTISSGFDVINTGTRINSEYDECGSTSYKDEFYFASNREWFHGNNWDIYFARKVLDDWISVRPLDEVNSLYSDASPSINREGNSLYFHSNRPGGFGKEDLYISKRIGNNWSAPENLGLVINSYYIDATPFISEDGGLLLVSSDRPGGEGGLDIWMSVLDRGEWTKPVNMGPSINTPYNEKYPLFVENTLFWASDRDDPFKNSNVFFKLFPFSRLPKPQILSYPVNSNDEDFGFYIDKNTLTGFISSSREGSVGGVDIWMISYEDVLPPSYRSLLNLFE
jgi:hypothetical protein